MKRKLLLLILAFSLSCLISLAYDIEVDGIYYNFSNNGTELEVTRKNGSYYSGEVVIPETVIYKRTTYMVTSIDAGAFYNCTGLTSINIPNSVTTIGYRWEDNKGNLDGAFYNCTGLTRLTIPNSVTSIGDYAFNGCTGLTSIDIPNSVTIIGHWAFYNCTRLKKIAIPNSVTSIGNYAFFGCTGLTSITIPNSVTSIRSHAFDKCTNLTNITIPNSVDSIEYDVICSDCPNLKRLVFLSDAQCDFYNNNSLKDIFTLSSATGAIFPLSANIYELDEYYNLKDTFTYTGFSPQNESYSTEIDGFTIEYKGSQLEERDAGVYNTSIECDISYLGDSLVNIPLEYIYTIKKVPLTISVQNSTREYGEENPTFIRNYSGFVNGEDENVLSSKGTFVTNALNTSNIGEYPITLSDATARNYEISIVPGTLTITKAPLKAKVDDISREYGDDNPTLTVKYEGLKNNESAPKWESDYILTTSATKTSSVGRYPITLIGTPINYIMEIDNGTLYVNPATLNVMATNKSRYYKENNPELTYTCTGFKNGENTEVLKTQPVLSTTAVQSSDAGIYPILINDAQADNYNIIYSDGELTVKKLTLNVTPNSFSRTYGEDNPIFTFTYSGFVEDENENNLLIAPIATTSATRESNVGTYFIYASGGVAVNYDFSYSTGRLTITKAYDTVTWEQDLDRVEWYTQVELKAESSSGRPITYTVSNPDICNIITIGDKSYLECTGPGQVVVAATLPGDKNHYEALKVYKIINIIATGIDNVQSEINNKEVKYITPDGRVFDKPQKGVNIVRMSDGHTRKIFVK